MNTNTKLIILSSLAFLLSLVMIALTCYSMFDSLIQDNNKEATLYLMLLPVLAFLTLISATNLEEALENS